MLGQKLPAEEGEPHAELVRAAKIGKLGAWKKFDVSEPRRDRDVSNRIAQTRWVLTWKRADGRKTVKARLATKGYRDPDIRGAPWKPQGVSAFSRRFSR